jgi:hypothetical protein
MISQIMGPFFGAVVGAICTLCVTSFNQWRHRNQQRRIATMQIASNLRRWMHTMAWNFEQTKLSVDSDGHGGTPLVEIPDFVFETSLEQIAILKNPIAVTLFNLINAKDKTNTRFKWCIEFQDEEDIFDEFRSQSATLFLDVGALYQCLSRQIGWSRDTDFDHHYTAMMKSEVERFEKIQADRVASNRALFGCLTQEADQSR